ncbi:MAG: HAD-IA family hydrolase [Gammaproteobacteria bacterium]
MHYELIVFDWDGTLMDSAGRIVSSLRAAIDDAGLPRREDRALANIIGLGLQEALESLFPAATQTDYDLLVERYRHYFLDADPTPTQLFGGARETLELLRDQGYWLAIATGKARRGLDEVLRSTDLTEFFQATRCADETCSKPHPHMLLEVMDEIGVTADRTLMVGDTEYDLLMAKNAGVRSLAVGHGVHEAQRLLACEPLALVENLYALQAWFQQHRKGLDLTTDTLQASNA